MPHRQLHTNETFPLTRPRRRPRPPNARKPRHVPIPSLVLAFLLASASTTHAASLLVEAPASCVDPTALADDVAEVIGKPLSSIADVDFRIQIAGTVHQRWRLRVETLDRPPSSGGAPAVRGTRELEAASCAELAQAAALAIAVSIRAVESVPASPVTAPVEAASSAPLVVQSAPASAKSSWHAGAGLGVVVESGVLPSAAPGVELQGQLIRGALGLVLRAAWFGSQDTIRTDLSGGSFQEASGTALGCLVSRERWAPFACAGLQLGRLAGTGLNVARPHTAAALWTAGRAEAGLARRVGSEAAVFVRAGVAVPFARPTFVLDESQPVYRPARLAGSLAGGFELEF